MNWKSLEQETEKHILLEVARHNTGGIHESAIRAVRVSENIYGRALKSVIARRFGSIVQKHSDSWVVKVRVSPMMNWSTRPPTAKPWIEVRWANNGSDFRFTALIIGDASLERFLERFEATVKANK